MHTAAKACIQLTEGEVMEGRFRHNSAATLKDYIAVSIARPRRCSMPAARVAADLAGASKRTIDAMEKLGTAMGLAFQMVDDLLDILGPEEKIGKPVGSDLRAGIPSLPVVLGVERSAELRALFQNATRMEGEVLERALELLRDPKSSAPPAALPPIRSRSRARFSTSSSRRSIATASQH